MNVKAEKTKRDTIPRQIRPSRHADEQIYSNPIRSFDMPFFKCYHKVCGKAAGFLPA